MSIDFDNILHRKKTNCKRWDTLDQYHPNIIPMGIADMDFPCPPEIIEALKKRLDHPCFGYTYPTDNLKELIVQHLQAQHGWTIKKEWIIFYTDATTSLYFIFNGIKNKLQNPSQNQVILQPPVFGPFFNDIKRASLLPLVNPLLLKDSSYSMDFEGLQNIFQKNKTISSLIVCNPHNPIGKVWSKEELLTLGNLCVQNNCITISDELHSDLILPKYKHTPIASLSPEIEQNTITLISPGKGYNIAGLKTSAAIIPNDEIRSHVSFVTNNMDPNILGMIAYETALTHAPKNYTPALMKYIEKNFDYVDQFLKSHIPNIKLTPPQATFLAWIDMRSLKMTNTELEDFMLNKAKIHVIFGHTFGESGEGFIRLNIGAPLDQIKKALFQLKEALTTL